ncbi:MAG TPA: RDD family protein [Burkholderiales bacterium]|nr:RDD family protein [Burkholderiales bacterium]
MDSGLRAAPGRELSGIGRRLLSMLYESLVVFAIAFFAGLAFYGAAGGRMSGSTRHVFQVYLFLVVGVYFIACWCRGGQTLPMQTWKLRLEHADGRPLEVRRALLRYALAWPSLLVLGVGILWALVDRDRQFLHDRLAGTRIVSVGARIPVDETRGHDAATRS